MLEVSGIGKTFHAGTPNEVFALRDVSFKLLEGSFLIIIGTNGSIGAGSTPNTELSHPHWKMATTTP